MLEVAHDDGGGGRGSGGGDAVSLKAAKQMGGKNHGRKETELEEEFDAKMEERRDKKGGRRKT